MLFPVNASNILLSMFLVDDNDDPIVGLNFDDVLLTVTYKLETGTTWVVSDLEEGILGEYLENSWQEIGDGWYQWCPPNAAIVPNTTTLVGAVYDSNKKRFGSIEARLPAVATSGAVELTADLETAIAETAVEVVKIPRVGESHRFTRLARNPTNKSADVEITEIE